MPDQVDFTAKIRSVLETVPSAPASYEHWKAFPSPPHGRKHPSDLVLAMVLAASVLSLVLAATMSARRGVEGSDSPSDASRNTNEPFVRGVVDPLAGGQATQDLAGAMAVMPFPVHVPVEGSSVGSVKEVWFRDRTGVEAIRFIYDDMTITWSRVPWADDSPVEHFRSLIAAGVPGEIRQDEDTSTFVVTPPPLSGQVPSVSFVADGVYVELVAQQPTTSSTVLLRISQDILAQYEGSLEAGD